MYYQSVSTTQNRNDISVIEKGYIEQIAMNFYKVANQPSEWYAGVTHDLESSLIKHQAYGADYTSINMDEKKYATYLKSLLIKRFGFDGSIKGAASDKSTIVYIFHRQSN